MARLLDDSFLENLIKLINFEDLFKIFNAYQRFRRIYPTVATDLNYAWSTDEMKKQFVHQCLEKDEKEFIGLLLHIGDDKAAEYVESTVIDLTDPSKLDPSKGLLTTNCPHVQLNPALDKLKKPKDSGSLSNQYNMTKTPRGLCLIINNYFTYGTFKETQRFRNIFYQFHFDVIVERNLTAQQIKTKLNDMSKDPVLEKHEAFACLIISHGTEKAEIIGFDNKRLEIKELCQLFDDKNCPKLKGKPRMFVYNCCRGSQDYYDYYLSSGKLAPNESSESPPLQQLATPLQPEIPTLPKILDFLICYSTLDGYAAYVDWDKGTKFGDVLCDSLVERGMIRDMNSILIRTNNTIQHFQPFSWEQTLTHLISFNPTQPFERQFL